MRNNILSIADDFTANRNYWFLRTEDGTYYNTYYEHKSIAIGYDQITLNDLTNYSEDQVKAKIIKTLKLDKDKSKDKAKATRIYNQLRNFTKMTKGDIVIIPSKDSRELAFGQIEDVTAFNSEPTGICRYTKRRKVKWITTKKTTTLDPIFLEIRSNHQTIFHILKVKHQQQIDKIISPLFIKGGKGHMVFDIRTTGEINMTELTGLFSNIDHLTKEINKTFDFKEDLSGNSVRLNLQSPGIVELIMDNGKSLILFSVFLLIGSCSTPTEKQNIVKLQSSKLNISQKDLKDSYNSCETVVKDTLKNLDKFQASKDFFANLK